MTSRMGSAIRYIILSMVLTIGGLLVTADLLMHMAVVLST